MEKAPGKKISLHVTGIRVLTDEVTPELVLEVFNSVSVNGIFHAPEAVKKAL